MEDRNWKDAPEDVDYRDWENSCTEKLRVPGGWVIRTSDYGNKTEITTTNTTTINIRELLSKREERLREYIIPKLEADNNEPVLYISAEPDLEESVQEEI